MSFSWPRSIKNELVFYSFIYRDENEVVPSVVEALLQVPETAHASVRFTTLLLLGELSEWLDRHPAFVGKVFL